MSFIVPGEIDEPTCTTSTYTFLKYKFNMITDQLKNIERFRQIG